MNKSDISFGANGVMFVSPTGVRMLSRCIASSEYSCTFKYFAALNVNADTLKDIIYDMVESETVYDTGDKSIIMQTMTERDAYSGKLGGADVMAVGEIDMTNHVITSTADFTEVFVHIPNRFGTKPITLNNYNEINLDIETYEGQPQSFCEYCSDGRDFDFNAIALYLNLNDGKHSYNSLYGIYVPSKDAEVIHKYAYAEGGSIVQAGNSFGFRINLRLVQDTDTTGDVGTIQTVVDEDANSFSMSIFTDALARMQMILSQNKTLSEAMSALSDDVRNLQALCDTGTTIAELTSKVNALSEYIDNYMLAIEDKDSILNMVANLNRQLQSILNGTAGPELNINIPIQAGEGISIAKEGSASVINNTNQRYNIGHDGFTDPASFKATKFTPNTFSNLFPVYRSSKSALNTDLKLSIDASGKTFHKGQSFQFVIMDDIEWGGYSCKLYVGDKQVGEFDSEEIQCAKPIFEIVCIDDGNNENGGTLQQCAFWSRCINPKFEGDFGKDSILHVTYDEACKLASKGSLQMDKVYHLTDYAFEPKGSKYVAINDDIKINIYLRASDKIHFDPRVFFMFNDLNGKTIVSWGKYLITKELDEVKPGCELLKGYITQIDYNSVAADFDFLHCAISKDTNPSFRGTTGEFLQSLQGGNYDEWITSSELVGSNCSVSAGNMSCINPTYEREAYVPVVDIKNVSDVTIVSHNDSLFKLPIMHISKSDHLCIHECDNFYAYDVRNSNFTRVSDIMAKQSEWLNIESCDNIRLWKASHITADNAFNSWVFTSENIGLRNATAVLLDFNTGTDICGITGNAVVILNYFKESGASMAQKAVIDNTSDSALILDNLTTLAMDDTQIESWRLICNRYNALAAQTSTGSTGKQYYIVKKIAYLDAAEDIAYDTKKTKVTSYNIGDLI